MASSSLPFPQATATLHNPKADQIISRYLHKVVLVVANARLTNDSPESQDNTAPGTPGLSSSDGPGGRGGYMAAPEDDGSGTPTGSITAVHPSRADSSSNRPTVRRRPAGPKVDKWVSRYGILSLCRFNSTTTSLSNPYLAISPIVQPRSARLGYIQAFPSSFPFYLYLISYHPV